MSMRPRIKIINHLSRAADTSDDLSSEVIALAEEIISIGTRLKKAALTYNRGDLPDLKQAINRLKAWV